MLDCKHIFVPHNRFYIFLSFKWFRYKNLHLLELWTRVKQFFTCFNMFHWINIDYLRLYVFFWKNINIYISKKHQILLIKIYFNLRILSCNYSVAQTRCGCDWHNLFINVTLLLLPNSKCIDLIGTFQYTSSKCTNIFNILQLLL